MNIFGHELDADSLRLGVKVLAIIALLYMGMNARGIATTDQNGLNGFLCSGQIYDVDKAAYISCKPIITADNGVAWKCTYANSTSKSLNSSFLT